MAYLLLFLLFFSSASAKVYDCFLFFNELEILDIRLHEMDEEVDYFVLVESAETFRGHPKPLYFEQNKERYVAFKDKIIHVIVDEHLETDDPWAREKFQRNQIMRGLQNCSNKDIILISDVDEIIRAEAIPLIENHIKHHSFMVGCDQVMYYFQLNRFKPDWRRWRGSIGTSYRFLKTTTPEHLRKERRSCPEIQDAGWHFTWMGGIERIIRKDEAYSHGRTISDFDAEKARWEKEIADLPFIPIDKTFPRYIRRNIDYFRSIKFIAES